MGHSFWRAPSCHTDPLSAAGGLGSDLGVRVDSRRRSSTVSLSALSIFAPVVLSLYSPGLAVWLSVPSYPISCLSESLSLSPTLSVALRLLAAFGTSPLPSTIFFFAAS
jgi:hypothetical protein